VPVAAKFYGYPWQLLKLSQADFYGWLDMTELSILLPRCQTLVNEECGMNLTNRSRATGFSFLWR
jgi:hypothetical protein